MRFRIFGNGAFGTALSKIFHKNMILEDSMQDQFHPILKGDILIPAVPSDACISVINKLIKLGSPDAIMLVSKGLFSNKLLTDECNFDIPLLYFAGPNLAKEIMTGNLQFLSATIAGSENFTCKIKEFLDDIIIDTTTDLVLPQVAAVIKNVTAFVIGYLEPTQNARATIIMQGMKEALILAQKLGSKETDILRGCFGDFVLTCTSHDSRNFTAGVKLRKVYAMHKQASFEMEGKGLTQLDMSVTQESLKSVDNIYALKGKLHLPIVEFFYNLVKEGNGKLQF